MSQFNGLLWRIRVQSRATQIQNPPELYTVIVMYWGNPWTKHTNRDVDTHWLSGKHSREVGRMVRIRGKRLTKLHYIKNLTQTICDPKINIINSLYQEYVIGAAVCNLRLNIHCAFSTDKNYLSDRYIKKYMQLYMSRYISEFKTNIPHLWSLCIYHCFHWDLPLLRSYRLYTNEFNTECYLDYVNVLKYRISI